MEMSYWAPFTSIIVGLIALGWSAGLWKGLYVLVVTAPRDFRIIIRYIKTLYYLWQCQRSNRTVADAFDANVVRFPNKPCFVIDDRVWTFKEVSSYSNRVANAFRASGFRRGDVVALMLENCPEFVTIWLGLSKLGVVCALVNTNQRHKSLLHSLEIVKCKSLIYGAAFKDSVNEILDNLPIPLTLYQLNNIGNTPLLNVSEDFEKVLSQQPDEFQCEPAQKPGYKDVLLYIYTSGTTGLPKAAIITNYKFFLSSKGFGTVNQFKIDDVFYTPLPLYHSAGGCMTAGQALISGSTVALRKKFSASQYFADCKKYGCTAGQYIGEMCRYMLATSPSPADKDHKLRLMYGNGLRSQIWTKFLTRFGIDDVREFYASTEGNTNLVNMDGKVGVIGYIPFVLKPIIPTTLIRAHRDTGEPLRGPDGLCQKCGPNEPGLCIGTITKSSSSEFLGYVDKTASEKKVIHNVFRKGDSAFISGDILQRDDYGYFYFIDRTGDTFRWKGENVSTSEVEAVVSNLIGLRDAIVYGVTVGNAEGRAGMAAILDTEDTVDLTKLSEGLQKSLATYARPQFIRLLKKVDLTGTYKMRKIDLQKDGFDPGVVADSLFYMTSAGSYAELTKEVFNKIVGGEIRF